MEEKRKIRKKWKTHAERSANLHTSIRNHFFASQFGKKKIEKLWGNEPFHTLLAKVQNAATSTERKLILHNKNNPFDPATPLLGIYPEDTPLKMWNNICT